MSIRYINKPLSAFSDQINNKTPLEDRVFSSGHIESVVKITDANIDDLGEIKPSVKGVVGTHTDLINYDLTRLQTNDILYVLTDETHNNQTSYYRWKGQLPFEYIGSLAPYYTPTEIDTFINQRQELLVSGQNIKTLGGISLLGEGNIITGYYLNIIYPIGSIYMTTDKDFNPNTGFGGTWEKIQNDTFLYATAPDRNLTTIGATVGAETVTLAKSHLPGHLHPVNPHTHAASTSNGLQRSTQSSIPSGERWMAVPAIRGINSNNNDGAYDDFELGTKDWATDHTTWSDTDWLNTSYTASVTLGSATSNCKNTGGGQAHNNIPPYYTAFIWKRTS